MEYNNGTLYIGLCCHEIYSKVQTILLLKRKTSVNILQRLKVIHSFNRLDMERRFLSLIWHAKQIQSRWTVVSSEVSRAQQGRGLPSHNAPMPEPYNHNAIDLTKASMSITACKKAIRNQCCERMQRAGSCRTGQTLCTQMSPEEGQRGRHTNWNVL